ncbi:reverse transcriptase domain-containing protein [Hoeflea sp.]|uniref:reverse transcriptase domain-containing protein n=1 Tax=Hoeflea sp. TaxID=1940281 RepID=UPI003B025A42
MSDEVNISFVLDMQRKLYRWSNEDPDKVFADLFNLVCDRRTLEEAWRRLARNRGSLTPGTDRMTRRMIEQRPDGVAGFLDETREALCSGTYRPQPVRQRLIPKPGKPGKFRPLGIPTLIDRLVQMALKLVLEPIFEADFYPTSYGFRRGRSTHDALARIQRFLHPTKRGPSVYRYVIEGDIKGCFDAIDHHVMMERVRKRISDRKVLRLILSFLKAGVMVEGTERHPVTGSPQGGIISPMLSNIYLTAIDERYGRWTGRPREPSINPAARRVRDHKKGRPVFYTVRYADDCAPRRCEEEVLMT